MKVSETVIPKKQNGRGTGTCRKDLTADSKGNCARRNGNDILKSQQTPELERTLKAKNVVSERTAEKQSDMKHDPQTNGNKKPWIPCTRRPSKPKPLPTTLEMDLSSVDSKKVCKKFPKSPTSPDSIPATAEPIDKQKAKHSSTNASTKQSNTACRYMVATISSSAASAAASLAEKRSKVILKRQYALDKATCNMKESYSEESLNSIHSVTQLLKIERSEFAFNKNDRGKILDEDEEKEETLTGVKLIAAKLEAKNLANKNNSFNKHGPSGVTARRNNRGDNENIQNKRSGDDSGSPSRLRSFQQSVQQNNLTHGDNKSETIKGCREEEKKKATTSTIITTVPSCLTSQELRENSDETTRNAAKSITAKSSETSSSASSLLTAAVAVASAVAAETTMSRAERKIVSTKNLVPSSDTRGRARPSASTSGTPNNKIKSSSLSSASSTPSTERKEHTSTLGTSTLGTNLSNPKSIRSRSSSPNKSLNNRSNESTTSKRKDTSSCKATPEATTSTRSRSASASRQRSSATAGGQQAKEIKERKQEVLSTNVKDKSQSTSQAGVSTAGPNNYVPRGRERQKRSIKQDNIRESQSLGRRRKDESRDKQFENSAASSTSVTSTSKSKTPPRNSDQAGNYLNATTSSRTKFVARAISKNDNESRSKNKETKAAPQEKKDKKCKSRVEKSSSNTNNSNRLKVTKSLSKKNSEESDLSLSSLSSGSSSSFCGTTWKSSPYIKQEQRELEKKDISIPTIVMSEYVEGEREENGKSAELFAHSQDLHIPLQFIEPLEPTCDIVEGSSLELKVRIRGAETVIWVKEDKVIPNAPPDFQYFHEKSKDVYGLRIADVFVEDAGLYAVKTFGARGSKITCWCEVDVLETGTNEDDDEDISWGDSDVSEEIKNQKPLVVPVIVTSQAEPDSDSSLSFDISKESPPTKTTVSEQTVKEKEKECERMSSLENNSQSGSGSNSNDCENIVSANASFRSSKNESAFLKLAKSSYSYEEDIEEEDEEDQEEEEIVKSYSQNDVSSTNINYATGGASAGHPVTEFTSKEAEVDTRFSQSSRQSKFFATSESSEMDHNIPADKSGMGSSVQEGSEKRKLVSELSSASDESIYMREATRSGDEGAHFSAEEMLTSISPLINARGVTNENEEDLMTASESPPQACSPCSEQNGRSSSVDSAIGFLGRPLFSDGKFPPRILVGPSSILALYGEVVHLRVKVQNYGIPKTAINWFKFVNGTYRKIEQSSGDLTPVDAHVCVTKCGSLSTLTVSHINYDDCGRYRVKVQNVLGMDSHDMILTVEGPPEPPSTPPKVKYDEKAKTILIQWSSCPYDGGAKITGYYVEASIVHGSKTALNKEDQDQWYLLTPQSYSWLCYTLTNPKRGSVYKFRVFGENVYGKGKPTDPSLPLLVPILMEGRRAGSSDALLWSLKSLSQEETVLRADPKRNKAVLEHENETAKMEESTSSQEEEPVEYRSVDIKRNSFYDVYDKLDELGKGRFGVVFEVVNKETKHSHAGKFVKCIKAKDKERVQLEVKIMNDLGYHPKLICLIDAFEMAREIIIVTQRIDGGELFERVVLDDFTLTEGDCITFLRQICDAVKYIHEKNIMHLDLKPENILCTSKNSNQIKIIDFGLAQYHDPKEQLRVLFGTAEFVSPEIINYEPIAPSTDNWSVGVITYILLSGLSPFMGDNDNETFSNITRAEFDFEDEAFEKISDDAKDFISNLLVKRPEKRMTAEQCLNHRWLENEHKKDVILSTDKLKRFLVRRKWQKTGNAIRALGRITTLYSSRRSSSSSGSMSSPTSHPFSPSRTGSLATQDSLDNDNVFLTQSPSLPESHRENDNFSFTNINNANLNNNNINDSNTQSKRVQLCETKNQQHFIEKNESTFTTHRTKFTDPCRSDSGVCDVGSCSSSLNYE